eukprot:4454459-Pleurochrysis_carterae.AAC.2
MASDKFYPPTIPSEAGSLEEQADRTGRIKPGEGAARSLVPSAGAASGPPTRPVRDLEAKMPSASPRAR